MSSSAELQQLIDDGAEPILEALADIAEASLGGDKAAKKKARDVLERRLAKNMAVADLFGRREMLMRIRALGDKREFAQTRDVEIVPNVPFDEAIADLTAREPTLAEGWQEAQAAYRAGAFALAKSTELKVTERVQAILERALENGMSRTQGVEAIVASVRAANPADELGGGFTRAYADTVFRTNMASSYEAGRHRQAQNPAMRKTVSGWRYNAINDPDVRPNHIAGEGFIAHMDDPVWEGHAPPLGYQCRCTLELVRTRQMRKLGLSDKAGAKIKDVPAVSGWKADAGFIGGRPDRKHYAS